MHNRPHVKNINDGFKFILERYQIRRNGMANRFAQPIEVKEELLVIYSTEQTVVLL